MKCALGWMKVNVRIVLNDMFTLIFIISKDMAPKYPSELLKNKCTKQ